jgi:hypothetical protein
MYLGGGGSISARKIFSRNCCHDYIFSSMAWLENKIDWQVAMEENSWIAFFKGK